MALLSWSQFRTEVKSSGRKGWERRRTRKPTPFSVGPIDPDENGGSSRVQSIFPARSGSGRIWLARPECRLRPGPIRANHVAALNGLPDRHADPFDRMLIAQAKAEELTVLANDQTIHQYPVKVRW